MKKQRRVEWAKKAESDLREIARYIARDNRQAAHDFARYVRQVAEHLAVSPIGRVGELNDSFEKVLSRYPSYIIIYQYDDSTLNILRVYHTAQSSKTWLV